MNISKKLKPLVASLKRIEIGKYLHDKEFELFALENDIDSLWNEAKREATKNKRVFTAGYHNTEEEEKAFAILIDAYYTQDLDFFRYLIMETVLTYCEWSRTPIDVSGIHKALKFLDIFNKQDLLGFLRDARKIRDNKPAYTPTKKSKTKSNPTDRTKVFIVHGHDDNIKTKAARFVERLGFEAIILHEQASSSKTIIEKIEAYSDVGFAIILYTPCDVGAKKTAKQDLKSRARQNVVFEHGYFIGKIGRENVCALVKGDLQTPNDISGVVYIPLDESDAWCYSVAKEMKESGYIIDMNKI